MNCPQCGDTENKFAVSLTTGAFNCLHLNNCGIKGSFFEFQKLMGDTPKSEKRDRFANPPAKKYTKPATEIKPPTPPVIAYLNKRGFTRETLDHFKVGAFDNDTAMLPYYRNGELINVKYRSITDKKKMRTETNAEPILFNRDQIYDNRLIICEGEYDAMALYYYGLDAVSVPMGAKNLQWIDTEWEYLETFDEIYLCFDMDQAGQEAARLVAARLGEWRCRIVRLPKKDANECLLAGVAIHGLIDQAETITPETLVSTLYFEEQVQDLFRLGPQLFGVPTAWEELNHKLKGWRGSEVTVWSGRNGSGKSTILNQHLIDMAQKGVKSCIFSGEMPPARYLRWAVVQHKENDAPSPAAIQSSLAWMNDKIFILNITNGVEPSKLLSDFEYAARRYGVTHFVVDSLMKVSLDMRDEYNAQKDFISSLCDFAQKFNVHVHVVAHPRKTFSDDDTPGKVDVKGSSHITDLAHNVIVLNRTTDEQREKVEKKGKTLSDAQMYLKKNREFGIEGKIHLWFNEKTKRYRDGEG
jgi:twinkle protein